MEFSVTFLKDRRIDFTDDICRISHNLIIDPFEHYGSNYGGLYCYCLGFLNSLMTTKL